MADVTFSVESGGLRPRTDWRAVWAGAFIFYAIWAVFGALGFAIFASTANPNAVAPVAGQNWGISIWSIVLTIIAMYVAGRETGRLANVATRHDGLIHGLIMFGLAIVGTILLVSIGGTALAQGNGGVAGNTHNPYVLNVATNLGWAGFVALILGWLAAMFGAASGVSHKPVAPVQRTYEEPRQIRPAA